MKVGQVGLPLRLLQAKAGAGAQLWSREQSLPQIAVVGLVVVPVSGSPDR